MAEFPYRLIRSARKTICLEIGSDGILVVRCPQRTTTARVEAVIREKADWIRTHLEKHRAAGTATPFTQAQRQALGERTRTLLAQRLPVLARQVGVTYNRVTVRAQRTRWGSCSSKGNLNFNCLLALLPPFVSDYVIVHELCHLKEMNHSSKFWAQVEKILPDYKLRRKWLKDNGGVLIRRL